MKVSIREAVIKDVNDIVKLNSLLFEEDGGRRDKFVNTKWPSEEGNKHFTKLVDKENSLSLIAERKGEIIGYLVGYTKNVESWRPVKRTEIESMYIKRQFRNKGIGKKLVDEFKKWAKEKGAKRILVSAFAKNIKAIKFYKRERFEPTSISLEAAVK